MSDMPMQVRHGAVGAVGKYGPDLLNLLEPQYDLVIWASSFDERVNVLAEIREGVRANKGLYLDYEGVRDDDRKQNSHRVVSESLGDVCNNEVESARLSPLLVEDIWETVADLVGRQFVKLGRPLNVLCDIVGTPRYVTLGLLGRGFRQGVIRNLSFVYSEAQYPDEDSSSKEVVFSTGEWRLLPIPGLSTEIRQDAKEHVIASVGFEGERVRRVVSALDPHRVSILFPDPGVSEKYAQRAWDRNRRLFDLFKIGDDQIIHADAANAVSAWKALSRSLVVQPSGANVVFVCGGSKPHSLALALECLTRPRSQALYILPEEHRAVRLQPTERRWVFEIRNHAALL
jgi:hypothetical protein